MKLSSNRMRAQFTISIPVRHSNMAGAPPVDCLYQDLEDYLACKYFHIDKENYNLHNFLNTSLLFFTSINISMAKPHL